MLKTNYIFGAALSATLSLLTLRAAHAGAIPLSGTNADGYLALIGFNQEAQEPNSGVIGAKPFDYPYYDTPGASTYFVMLVEPYTTTLSYPGDFPSLLHPEDASTNVAVTGFTNGLTSDADFSNFNIGSITYDDALLTGAGSETIGVANFTLTLSAADFQPNPARFNPGEFAFTFGLSASNLTGTGLTFLNGVLQSIDFSADVALSTTLFGSFAGPVYSGSLSFAASNFAFALDDVQDIVPLATDVRILLNRSGSVAIPEPGTVALLLGGAGLLFSVYRKKSNAVTFINL